MSDSNANSSPSIFKHALSRSKSFLTNLKISPTRPKVNPDAEDEDSPSKKASSKRRMRVIAESERRENPLNLGENGWGSHSWSNLKHEQRQKDELDSLWSEIDSVGRSSGTTESHQSKVSPAGPRAPRGSRQERTERRSPQEQRCVSSGSPAQYYRPLPFRDSEQRDSPSPSRPARTSEAKSSLAPSSQQYRTSGPYLSKESAMDMEARLASRLTSNNPQRTRVAGPRPNHTPSRSGTYTSKGVRVTPGSYADRERQVYLSKAGGNVDFRASRGSDGSAESRAADGTRKAPGGTLF